MFKIYYEPKQYYLYNNNLGLFYNKDKKVIEPLLLPNISKYTISYLNKVYSTFHSKEYFKNHAQIINNINYESKHKPDLKKVKLLDITLGMNCNYKCKYCLQNEHRDDIKFIPEEFLNILKNSDLNFNSIENIRIWGGEPLVYWKRFKKLIKLLRKDIQYTKSINTVSNGSLFNLEKANYCIDNNIHIAFSHDGPAQTILRDPIDYLDNLNIRSSIKYLMQKGLAHIILVLNPYNYDIKETIKFLEKKLYIGFPIKLSTVFKADSRSKDILKDYGKNGLETLKNNLLWGLNLKPNDPYYSYFVDLRRIRDTTIRHIIYKLPYASFKARCPSYNSIERLSIDTEGRLLTCYADNPLNGLNHGNIKDISTCGWNLKSIHDREICKHCPYIMSCMGGCPLLNEEDHKIRCQSMMPYNQALFESAFKEVFGKEIIKIEEI